MGSKLTIKELDMVVGGNPPGEHTPLLHDPITKHISKNITFYHNPFFHRRPMSFLNGNGVSLEELENLQSYLPNLITLPCPEDRERVKLDLQRCVAKILLYDKKADNGCRGDYRSSNQSIDIYDVIHNTSPKVIWHEVGHAKYHNLIDNDHSFKKSFSDFVKNSPFVIEDNTELMNTLRELELASKNPIFRACFAMLYHANHTKLKQIEIQDENVREMVEYLNKGYHYDDYDLHMDEIFADLYAISVLHSKFDELKKEQHNEALNQFLEKVSPVIKDYRNNYFNIEATKINYFYHNVYHNVDTVCSIISDHLDLIWCFQALQMVVLCAFGLILSPDNTSQVLKEIFNL